MRKMAAPEIRAVAYLNASVTLYCHSLAVERRTVFPVIYQGGQGESMNCKIVANLQF